MDSTTNNKTQSALDQLDFIFIPFMKILKNLLFRFMARAIRELRKELCFGCQTDHLSQHGCLEATRGYFYLSHRKELFDRVMNHRLPEAVQWVISQRHGILYPRSVITTVSEAFLFDLLHEDNIEIVLQSECNEVDEQVLEKFWFDGKQGLFWEKMFCMFLH